MLYNGVAQGSRRHRTYSHCEYTRSNYCRYSHSIFNLKRILKLVSLPGVIRLNYGHGFERYGSYETTRSGWDRTLQICSDGQEANYNLPKAILLAEKNRSLTWVGAPEVQYEKKQSLCQSYQNDRCKYGPQCRFDHDLDDGNHLEKLARWVVDDFSTYNYLTVECHRDLHEGIGPRPRNAGVHWKITLKPNAFKKFKANDPIAKTAGASSTSF
ncbi:hypothetical protein K435DRAFT_685020 [Dendrothele bispora CBS 962.96]|uniref:C3H1-type domain-containing protein n=1 Tax=Dendrothele bispora (strain CBS 962.96) TaxID=1314807 RepID=A0A4S8LAA6_DENBC|nr:hypothetical protein K435DRAFT_685020 [Dendrothele bispora CBS 962.96]